MLMLDLCAGLGGASQPMRDRGWDVVTVDNDPRFGCTITADLRTWRWDGPTPDLIWLSDPCTEFSRESMPWCKTGNAPSLDIFEAGMRIIRAVQPRYWVRENVRGSVPWVRAQIGEPRQRFGPFFLWGTFPPLGALVRMRKKESYSSTQQAERARVPYAIGAALAEAIESQQVLWPASALIGSHLVTYDPAHTAPGGYVAPWCVADAPGGAAWFGTTKAIEEWAERREGR